MKANGTFLFRKLRVRNYKLHRETESALDHPITLITGANGSGKTQMLEALKFCLGSHPARVPRVESCIGPFGEEAELQLELSNPVIGGKRLFTSTVPEIAELLDCDTVTIIARIKPEPSVQYRIAGKATRGVTRGDVREVFAGASVFPANRLAFTEEGVVDIFAGESARMKLQTLLEATGRRQYLDDLREAASKLRKSQEQNQPLIEKLKWQRSLYQTMLKKMELIRKRSDLLRRYDEVRLLRHWGEVRDLELKAQEIGSELGSLESRLDRMRSQLAQSKSALCETERQSGESRRALAQVQEEMRRRRDEQSRLVGRREICLERMSELEERRKQLIVELETLRAGGAVKSRPSEEGKRLAQLEQELSSTQARLEEVSSSLEEALKPSDEPLTRFESTLIESARQFRAALDSAGLANVVVGPAVSFVSMKPGEEEFEKPVKALAGKYLFSFVALDRTAYEEARRVFGAAFVGHSPPLTVGRASGAAAKSRDNPPKSIYAFAIDLLDGDPRVLGFLGRVLRGAIAGEGATANELTDFAESAGIPVITRDCRSYYLPIGAFTSPPPVPSVSLGSHLRASRPATPRALAIEQGELLVRERMLLKEIETLRRRRAAPSEAAAGQRLGLLEDELRETYLGWDRLRRQESDARERIKELSRLLQELSRRETVLLDEIAKSETAMEPKRTDVARIEAKVEQEERVVERFRAELSAVRAELAKRQEEAEKVGPRPGSIGPTADLLREESELKGRMEAIAGDETTEENLKRRQQELVELERYVAERTSHMAGLEQDLKQRSEVWKSQIQELVDKISNVMNTLLLEAGFKQVRIEVQDADDPDAAGLCIRARTKIDRWLDYSELSGGEKVLLTESVVMALHTLTDSPLHAIDEFTQRLDRSSGAAAFGIVKKTFTLAKRLAPDLCPQFIVVCPEAFGLASDELIRHFVLVEGKLDAR